VLESAHAIGEDPRVEGLNITVTNIDTETLGMDVTGTVYASRGPLGYRLPGSATEHSVAIRLL
jgi:hypothetical protein